MEDGSVTLGGILRKTFCFAALAVAISSAAVAHAEVHTNPLNRDPLVKEAFQHFYDLDYPGAMERFERFHQMHPGDPQATALLLETAIFQELYREDLLDTTFYSNDGFLTGRHATEEDPATRDRIFALADEAVREADSRISRNANDVDALYARGWVRALRCAYVAMVERAYGTGFRLATRARDDEEKVLQIDPDYVDAKLVAGVYEYVVGALPLPFKILIGFAGIGGSKSKGMALLWDAAHRGPASSVEARTVIALFLRREARYEDAIKVVQELEQEYPHDFLFALEEANLRKDAGQGMAGVRAYREVLANAARPGYYASAQFELAYFGLGEAERGQRHYPEAAEAYEQAAYTRNVAPELKIRSMVAAGQCRDVLHEREKAKLDYHMAIDAGPNTSRADTARKYLRSPYTGV
jgi:tetratricopeptide (TPR) repeat protein